MQLVTFRIRCFEQKIKFGRDSYPRLSVFPLSDGVAMFEYTLKDSIKRSHLYFYIISENQLALGNFADEEQNQTLVPYRLGITIFDKGLNLN